MFTVVHDGLTAGDGCITGQFIIRLVRPHAKCNLDPDHLMTVIVNGDNLVHVGPLPPPGTGGMKYSIMDSIYREIGFYAPFVQEAVTRMQLDKMLMEATSKMHTRSDAMAHMQTMSMTWPKTPPVNWKHCCEMLSLLGQHLGLPRMAALRVCGAPYPWPYPWAACCAPPPREDWAPCWPRCEPTLDAIERRADVLAHKPCTLILYSVELARPTSERAHLKGFKDYGILCPSANTAVALATRWEERKRHCIDAGQRRPGFYYLLLTCCMSKVRIASTCIQRASITARKKT